MASALEITTFLNKLPKVLLLGGIVFSFFLSLLLIYFNGEQNWGEIYFEISSPEKGYNWMGIVFTYLAFFLAGIIISFFVACLARFLVFLYTVGHFSSLEQKSYTRKLMCSILLG